VPDRQKITIFGMSNTGLWKGGGRARTNLNPTSRQNGPEARGPKDKHKIMRATGLNFYKSAIARKNLICRDLKYNLSQKRFDYWNSFQC
jgi:hypothetical protein